MNKTSKLLSLRCTPSASQVKISLQQLMKPNEPSVRRPSRPLAAEEGEAGEEEGRVVMRQQVILQHLLRVSAEVKGSAFSQVSCSCFSLSLIIRWLLSSSSKGLI